MSSYQMYWNFHLQEYMYLIDTYMPSFNYVTMWLNSFMVFQLYDDY